MDALTYHYKTNKPNQLRRVEDAISTNTNAQDIKNQVAENSYIYNSIGQLIENKQEKIKYEYNASGLVTNITYNNKLKVAFSYNDKGFRTKKVSYRDDGAEDKVTYYVRDASGSTLAIYEDGIQTELPIYGASRLGIYDKASNTSVYQLTDHLGNVRAVIAKETGTANAAALVHATDYYPGGMAMPGRMIRNGQAYRYGYQGEFAETDEETGKPAFQLRLYDPRINRWLSPDPMGQYHSPYMAMDNTPQQSVDPTGGCTDCSECPSACGDLGVTSIPSGQSIDLNVDSGYFMRSDLASSLLNEVTVTGYSNSYWQRQFSSNNFSTAGEIGLGMSATGLFSQTLILKEPLKLIPGSRVAYFGGNPKWYTSVESAVFNNKFTRPLVGGRNWGVNLGRAGNTLALVDTYLQFQELRANPAYGALYNQSQARLSGFEASLINTSAAANGIQVHPINRTTPNPNKGFLESFQFALDAFDKGTKASSSGF